MKLTTISLDLRNSNSGLPPIGFNIEPLLGSKYAGVKFNIQAVKVTVTLGEYSWCLA
jgi:hypothetical protein